MNTEKTNASINYPISASRPEIVEKVWGREYIIHNSSDYCAKLLAFKEGCSTSLQFHMKKKESWYVAAGEFTLYLIDVTDGTTTTQTMVPGDTITIPPGQPHRLVATKPSSTIFEVSTEHFDDDTYRIKIYE